MKQAGEKNLKGKVLIDVANPLDFSKGMPPSLLPELSNTNSLGEEIQKIFPDAKVVKTLNTMWCGLMVNPNMIAGGNHTAFICGNDTDAKAEVRLLMTEFGWKEENILDLGDISSARGTEAMLPIWLRIYHATQNGAFNVKVLVIVKVNCLVSIRWPLISTVWYFGNGKLHTITHLFKLPIKII